MRISVCACVHIGVYVCERVLPCHAYVFYSSLTYMQAFAVYKDIKKAKHEELKESVVSHAHFFQKLLSFAAFLQHEVFHAFERKSRGFVGLGFLLPCLGIKTLLQSIGKC